MTKVIMCDKCGTCFDITYKDNREYWSVWASFANKDESVFYHYCRTCMLELQPVMMNPELASKFGARCSE